MSPTPLRHCGSAMNPLYIVVGIKLVCVIKQHDGGTTALVIVKFIGLSANTNVLFHVNAL